MEFYEEKVKNGVSNIESRVLVEGDDDSASEK
jgi:hypothetical protein